MRLSGRPHRRIATPSPTPDYARSITKIRQPLPPTNSPSWNSNAIRVRGLPPDNRRRLSGDASQFPFSKWVSSETSACRRPAPAAREGDTDRANSMRRRIHRNVLPTRPARAIQELAVRENRIMTLRHRHLRSPARRSGTCTPVRLQSRTRFGCWSTTGRLKAAPTYEER